MREPPSDGLGAIELGQSQEFHRLVSMLLAWVRHAINASEMVPANIGELGPGDLRAPAGVQAASPAGLELPGARLESSSEPDSKTTDSLSGAGSRMAAAAHDTAVVLALPCMIMEDGRHRSLSVEAALSAVYSITQAARTPARHPTPNPKEAAGGSPDVLVGGTSDTPVRSKTKHRATNADTIDIGRGYVTTALLPGIDDEAALEHDHCTGLGIPVRSGFVMVVLGLALVQNAVSIGSQALVLEVAARGEISLASTEAFRMYVPFLPRAAFGVLMVAIGMYAHCKGSLLSLWFATSVYALGVLTTVLMHSLHILEVAS